MGTEEASGYVSIGAADREARRAASLLLALENASRPLPTTLIRSSFYGECRTDEAARKAFQRDRQRLAVCGVAIRRTRDPAGRWAWAIDSDASYSDPTSVSASDALALDVSLTPLANDPSFPYADELRRALAKIDRSFVDPSIPGTRLRPSTNDGCRATLRRCLAEGRPARIEYRRADGSVIERTVGMCGFFDLLGSTYAVATNLDATEPGPPHSYNLARVLRAVMARSGRFTPPDDFDIEDYMKLPFQLGRTRYVGLLSIDVDMARQLPAYALRHCDMGPERADGTRLLSVSVSDTRRAAAWAIEHGARPVAPEPLRAVWADLLRGACEHGEP